jgi:hypothetical protein
MVVVVICILETLHHTLTVTTSEVAMVLLSSIGESPCNLLPALAFHCNISRLAAELFLIIIVWHEGLLYGVDVWTWRSHGVNAEVCYGVCLTNSLATSSSLTRGVRREVTFLDLLMYLKI